MEHSVIRDVLVIYNAQSAIEAAKYMSTSKPHFYTVISFPGFMYLVSNHLTINITCSRLVSYLSKHSFGKQSKSLLAKSSNLIRIGKMGPPKYYWARLMVLDRPPFYTAFLLNILPTSTG